MKTILHSLTLFCMTALIVVSCGSSSSSENATNALPVAQATQSLADKVSVELTVQYDTAVVYNTVDQIVKFKYIVKMVRNDLTDATPANVAISGITASCPPLNTISNLNDRFDPGEVLECTGEYRLTQADLDRGSVSNVATANVYSVNSNTVTTNVPTVPSKLLTLTISADPTTYYQAGQTIKYTYTLKNGGSTQLGPTPPFTVTTNNIPLNCGNADATIAPGATLTCSSTYSITAADINVANITINATASGGGANPTQSVSLSISKVSPPAVAAGTNVQHTVKEGEWLWQLARCYGTDPQQTVNANPQVDPKMLKAGMVVTIPNVGSKGTVYIKSSSDLCVQFHTVVSGDTWTSIAQKYGADPGLTQLVNANVMTVGKQVKVPLFTVGLNIPLSNTTVTPSPSSTTLGLTVSPNTTTYGQSGQAITFTYTIKNTGTTSLGPAQFTVTDAFLNPSTFNCGAATTLSPGATTTCNAEYKVSDTDMNAVNIQFSTTASGGGVSASAVSTVITKGVAQLTLIVVPSITTYTQAGQIVNFTYTIKNSGSTTLGPTQFTVTDPFLNPSTFNCGPANTTLTPGTTTTCNGSYTITQQDVGAVNIQFSTTASGTGVPTSQAVPTIITKQ